MVVLKALMTAVADYAIQSDDHKLSIMGIFDRLILRSLPAHHSHMAFVAILQGEPRSYQDLMLKVISPEKKELFSAKVGVTLGENGKANFISNFDGFPFAQAGTYTIALEKLDKAVAQCALETILVKEPNQKNKVAN